MLYHDALGTSAALPGKDRREPPAFDEKPEDLAELAAEYHEHHNPADSDQRFLVDTLVHNEWRIRRIRRVEAELWQTAYNTFVVKISKSP